ncbi:ethylene-overproduction protein 1 [Selaginella moellendorffii]|uniref:ethylene-overproduction protein 1 n=1 Tax=Selaginella moellendorffii TaxID=88036 RepID=UPI000D1CAB0C|nr:ethylene-overproduction protein 1 [Selaginella moellendorffii]|eukprot:XP_024533927.1 ethylene-overproduction protein 1 [Selaginella moellendorffii]
MRSLGIMDSCRSSQVHADVCVDKATFDPRLPLKAGSKADGESCSYSGLSVSQLADPPIQPYYKPVDYVDTLGQVHQELEVSPDHDKSRLYLEQSFVFRGLGELKLLRRSLRSAWQHATSTHEKLVYASWLKYERREEELDSKSADCCGVGKLDLPQLEGADDLLQACSTSGSDDDDIVFLFGSERVHCNRQKIAALSAPFYAMLNGCFTESQTRAIQFSENGISVAGMKVVDTFSKTGTLGRLPPKIILEVLSFSNRFFCERMKVACDQSLAALIHNLDDAIAFVDYGLEETAQVLVATCLQVFLRELPLSLRNPNVSKHFCNAESRKRFIAVGHSSFALYALLSQVAMEDDISSQLSASLLCQLRDCASSFRQRALVYHQQGCVMLARKQYKEALEFFQAAAEEGHAYSCAGIARVKLKCGDKQAAFKETTCLITCYKACGWMYQERSLYGSGKMKMADLDKATDLDPTLTYPYKYRAAALMDDHKVVEAIAEINRVLCFKVTPDCLELRIYFCLALQDYDGAVRDIRALLTLDPAYMMYTGRVSAAQLLVLLSEHVDQWTKADCWMQLYDRWSSVDDIGSLAVVHQMLETDPGKGLLYFRQSLLLLRLSCPKAAMRSLRLAREHTTSVPERLVYEGWILYDTGHRQEALQKAEESISIHRSFEAFFLKAYALADTSLDPESSTKVINLLEEALRCPSDGLRKGQALNNLGSVYVDCGKFDLAADCYVSALKIRHTRAHQGLARVHFLQGDRKSAYDEMTKLIEKACNKASAYEKRSEYCERDIGISDLNMVTKIDPLRTYPYRYRAAVLMDNHREQEAIAELSKAIAFKADLQLLHLRGAFYECVGDVAAALRDCRAALSVDPHHTDTLELQNKVMQVRA